TEILLLRIAAHVRKRQHSNSGLFSQGLRYCDGNKWRTSDAIRVNWLDNVFEALKAKIHESGVHLVLYVVIGGPRNENTSRLRAAFQASCKCDHTTVRTPHTHT